MGYIESGSETLDQNYTEGDGANSLGQATRLYLSQGFLPTVTGKLTKLEAELKVGLGSPSGDIGCFLYDNNGGEPGNPLATFSVVDASTVTASFVYYAFTSAFASAPVITAGVTYHLVLKKTPQDESNYLHVQQKDPGPYAGGYVNYGPDGSGWTATATVDYNFKQYYTPFNLTAGVSGYFNV